MGQNADGFGGGAIADGATALAPPGETSGTGAWSVSVPRTARWTAPKTRFSRLKRISAFDGCVFTSTSSYGTDTFKTATG